MDQREYVLNADQLRKHTPEFFEKAKNSYQRNDLTIVIDNVYDTYNIGSIFRIADAIAAKEVIICGRSETPDAPIAGNKIKRASINTPEWVGWRYFSDTKDAITKLRQENPEIRVVALELDPDSIPYTELNCWDKPVALVVGNESVGVDAGVLKMVDCCVEIPMSGINTSLNVAVATAIVSYWITMKGVIIDNTPRF
jgi:23S rRNA (guanosine2251-2'-O)-methyltransferase